MASLGIFDDDLVLPGVITEIIPDYTQEYDTSEYGSTETVTIIGTAFNGPVGKVVPIYSPEHAKYIFGDSFDSTTRREASLVANIYDAWDRGCRTINAIRVSGKEIYKDYNLATESKLKLRVSGIFPSNDNKDVFMHYTTTQSENDNAGTIRIFKPTNRSNMKEKMQGLVLTQSEMLVNEVKLAGYGLTKDSRLVDAINIVNDYESNNVIRLSIVNEAGIDVTTSKDAQALCLGVMFPGLYTIARDKMAEGVTIKTDIQYVLTSERKPHTNYQDAIWTELVVNTDVNTSYPIYAKTISELSALLPKITADADGEYLKPVGVIDKITIKNKEDYEEVELNDFDLYQRLGAGFAQTAHIIAIKNSTDDQVKGYKVCVPDSNDVNRVIGIEDGIYSMLENYSTDITVLASADAETKISGKLPRKETFKKRQAGVITLKADTADVLELTANIDAKDFSDAKTVTVTINTVENEQAIKQEDILATMDTTLKVKRVMAVAAADLTNIETEVQDVKNTKYPEGTIMVTGDDPAYTVKIVKDHKLEELKEKAIYLIENANVLKLVEVTDETASATVKTIDKDCTFIAINDDIANIYSVTTEGLVTPIAVLSQLANQTLDEDYTLTYVEELPGELKITVNSTDAQWMTYGELADALNEDAIFSKYFTVAAKEADKEVATKTEGTGEDKGETYYDTNMYVPYTTTDNFARHLAQHCVYTSLKTYPTHGVIGCARLNGVNLTTVANRVNDILALDLDLYAKKNNGNNMLDNNNMPHPIGRSISIPFMQYTVTTGNGYNYVSNGAAGYAGMISTLDADQSSTNQEIDLPTLAFELSNYQLSKLTGKGIVTVKNTTSGTVITDGITMAPVDSAYRRLSTTKIINVVDAGLREVISPFIGTPDNLANRNSLNTAITSLLNKFKDNLIRYYSFKVLTDSASSSLGIIKIQYVIIPFNEIKEVRNTISVQESN